jgi:hypothetical protein
MFQRKESAFPFRIIGRFITATGIIFVPPGSGNNRRQAFEPAAKVQMSWFSVGVRNRNQVRFPKSPHSAAHSRAVSGHPTPAELHETREKRGITEREEETKYPRQGSNL